MKKLYTLLALLLVGTISLSAQNKKTTTVGKKNSVIERKKESFKTKKNHLSLLRSTQQQPIILPDSVYCYNGDGNLYTKRVYTHSDEGRTMSWDEYDWDAEQKKFIYSSKAKITRDARGNELYWEDLYLGGNGKWYGEKIESEYDDKNKEIKSASYRWFDEEKSWKFIQGHRCEQVAGGYQYVNENFSFDSIGAISEGYKNVTKFSNQDLELNTTRYGWSIRENKWTNYSEIWNEREQVWEKNYTSNIIREYTYGDDGKPTSKVEYESPSNDPSQKFYSSKEEYKYKDGNVSEVLTYYSHDQKNQFTLYGRVLYGYDSNKNVTLTEHYAWDEVAMKWVKEQKEELKYDDRGNRTWSLVYTVIDDLDIWVPHFKNETKYDHRDWEIWHEGHDWVRNSEDSPEGYWRGNYRSMTTFSAEGYELYEEEQRWDAVKDTWGYGRKSEMHINAEGRPTVYKEYDWEDGEWVLDEYEVYMPYAPDNDIEVEESKPINDDNETNNFEGKFTLGLNIETDAIPTGKFDVILPDGFTLNEEETKLSASLADQLMLKLTQDAENKQKWVVAITSMPLRSAKSTIVYKSIVDIAYKVSENVSTQKNEILVKDLNFALSTGGGVIKEEVKITVAPKDVSSVESEELAERKMSFTNGVLTVNTPDVETITVYTVSGALILTVEKPVGEFVEHIGNSNNLIIVKGSEGWVKKLIAK